MIPPHVNPGLPVTVTPPELVIDDSFRSKKMTELSMEQKDFEYQCGKCKMFACPIFQKYPKTNGCNYGPDILDQIKKSKKSKSRDFDEIRKELGI
jgi:hypothetical protein